MKKSSRSRVTFESVRQAALSLTDVQEGTAWSFTAFRTSKKMFLCFREDLDSILVFVRGFDVRDEMIAAAPETYYTTDHHRPYPVVLARLSTLPPDAVPDLLLMSWRLAAATAKKRPAKRRRASSPG